MLAVILASILFGILLTLLVELLVFNRWFGRLPVLESPRKSQYEKFELPKEIQDLLRDPEIKSRRESGVAINLIFQFLFRELKDVKHVRRWVTKKLNNEFSEMLQTTTGKLLDQITVRDFNLGSTFPVISNIGIQSTGTKEEGQSFDELSLTMDLKYHGGFQLAVDVDLVFGKSAYLSVKVTQLSGRLRVQLARAPYTHWSMSFMEDPVMDFEVESQFDGRPVPQITSLIMNQIRRSVRKKHTLPNYKIRYKPFFVKPEVRPPAQEIYYHGSKLSSGHLEVMVIECSRLVKVGNDTLVYCTLAIDSLPWMELMSSRRKLWMAHDLEINKPNQTTSIGLTFKEEFIHEKYEEMVVVDSVTQGSPAHLADVRKNDVLIAVNGVKVTSSKQAAKLMKQSTERMAVRIERSTPLKGLGVQQEFRFEEDMVSLKDDAPGDGSSGNMNDEDESEEFINITMATTANGITDQPEQPITKEKRSNSKERLSVTSKEEDVDSTTSSSSKKAAFSSILTTSTGLFNRKRGRANSKTPRDSPEMPNKGETKKEDTLAAPATTPARRRSKTEIPATLKDKQSLWEKYDAASSTTESSSKEMMDDFEDESIDLRKTNFVKAVQDPLFNEKFEFEVEDNHNYMNVCVWCKIPEKLDKQNRIIKPEKDILLGHVSIPLMDVALDCLATLQGEYQQSFQLTPAEVKATASRTKTSNLATHSGFDERLCYGDITMAFVHMTQPLSGTERRRIEKIRAENEIAQETALQEAAAGLRPKRMSVQEGKHDFVGTHFQSVTYCNFCHKKIWLKVAFQCRECGMICHKKCTDKCQANTQCGKGGIEPKPLVPGQQPSQQPSPTPSRKSSKENDTKDANQKSISSSSFFGKFRKDSPKMPHRDALETEGAKVKRRRSLSPEPTHERRRHNSAPNENDNACEAATSLLSVSGIPRTRSSTSLQDLIQEDAAPVLQPTEIYQKVSNELGDDSSSSDYDSDDELNLLRFFERQKSSHNADEMVVTAAKEMGKELYAHLSPEERRDKLDAMVTKLQVEIDTESENRAELARQEKEASDYATRNAFREKIKNSDEKIQSLALLMLHYCAGLQHCLDAMEEQRLAALENEQGRDSIGSVGVGSMASGILADKIGHSRQGSSASSHSSNQDVGQNNSHGDSPPGGGSTEVVGTSSERNNKQSVDESSTECRQVGLIIRVTSEEDSENETSNSK